MSNESAFPRMNLAKYHATEVSVLATFDRHGGAGERFAAILEEDGSFLSALKYRRSRSVHVLYEFVGSLTNEDATESSSEVILVRIEYQTGRELPPGQPPKEMRRYGAVLPRLQHLVPLHKLICQAKFRIDEFGGEGGVEGMWFPLPAPITSPVADESPVDEIRGIRGAKQKMEKDGNIVEYTFTLDRPSNGPVFLAIEFEIADRLERDTPAWVLDRARVFAEKLGVL